ncbi:BT4734/BF3469 family protein [Spirosoma pomorum]
MNSASCFLLDNAVDTSQSALVDSNQVQLSVFGSDRLDGKPNGYINTKKAVEKIQTSGFKRPGSWRKVKLPYVSMLVTWSGRFQSDRTNENLLKHSGLLCIVINELADERISMLREALKKDVYTHILFKTPTNDGLNVVIKIDYKEIGNHEEYYYQIKEYLQTTYSVSFNELDESCKYVNKLCELSYDSNIYFNPDSKRLYLEFPRKVSSKESFDIEKASGFSSDPEQKVKTTEAESSVSNVDQLLKALLSTERQIKQIASREIVFSPALISREGVDIIRRGTINVIQGKYGQHKSRLAETLAASLIAKTSQSSNFLGFTRSTEEIFSVCYIDTERSPKEELPYAIQEIYQKAGYNSVSDNVTSTFRFTSIKSVARKERLTAVESFVNEARQSTCNHLVVFLDVITDCIESYNDDRQAMKLFDIVGALCENYDATFFLVIHENPSSEKARGHAGTEAANKASAVLQIGTENSGNGNGKPLVKLRYLKLRGAAKPDPLYLQYCDKVKGLVVAPMDFIPKNSELLLPKKISQVEIEFRLVQILSNGPMLKGIVYERLTNESGFSDRTVRTKIRACFEIHKG